MPQNSTKNILISVALITFIVLSGTFTIYQLSKRETNTTNNSKTSLQSSSLIGNSLLSSILSSSSLNANTTVNELTVKFDPYVCGFSITGLVDKPDIIQKLEFVLTNKDKAEINQSFMPKIDEAKNFRLLLDEKLISDGIYKLEAKASLNNQNSETTETTIEFKKDCTNLVQNSTIASQTAAVNSEVSNSSQAQTNANNSAQVDSATQQSSQSSVDSDLSRQTTNALPSPDANATTVSSSSAEKTSNPNSVRSGGLDITAIFLILMIVLSSFLVSKTKIKYMNINEVFGKK